MIKRISILAVLSGMPSISTSASIVNLDVISTDQDQPPYQEDSQNDFIKKPNNPLPNHENDANFSHTLDRNRSNESGFLNRSGLSQNKLDENNRVLDDIKTSLKGINNHWNEIEGRALFLLEMDNVNTFVNSASVDNYMLDSFGQQRQFIDNQVKEFDTLAGRQDPADIEQQLQDQPFLYQVLFFISIPHLLRLISENSMSLILLVLLWLFIKGLIEFVRWKKKKKARSRLKRKRSIDGFTKY